MNDVAIVRDDRGRPWVMWASDHGRPIGTYSAAIWFDDLTEADRLRQGWSPPWRTAALEAAVRELFTRNQQLERELRTQGDREEDCPCT